MMKFLVYSTHDLINITGMLFALMLHGMVKGNILTESFSKIAAPPGVVSGAITSGSSKIRCATMCSKEDTCASFAYNKKEKFCEMSDKIIAGPDKDTYVKRTESKEINECDREPCENNGTCVDSVSGYFCNCTVGFTGRNCSNASCPTSMGYELRLYPDMALCIRYSLTSVSDYQDADDQCRNDGGHLVLIENDSMRSHLVDIAQSHSGFPSNDFTYFDGRDQDGTKVFIDWKGADAWISWSGSNTLRIGDDCFVSKLTGDFFHWDGVCNTARTYLLCQIDI